MRDFRYVEPKNLEEAVAFLGKHPGEARLLAGGTDLLVKMKRSLVNPRYVVNLKTVRGMNQITIDERDYLRIGALATVGDVLRSSIVRGRWEAISLTAGEMASVQVRNVATAGGNLCNAAPSADFAPIMIALGAEVKLVGAAGARTVPLEEFFTGPGQMVLGSDEVMTEILVPPSPPNSAAVYIKHGIRKALDIAVVGVAVGLTFGPDTARCERARVVLGAVAPTPMRARRTEAVLEGNILEETLARLAGETAAEVARPITDVRASEYYRRRVVAALVERAVVQVLARRRVN